LKRTDGRRLALIGSVIGLLISASGCQDRGSAPSPRDHADITRLFSVKSDSGVALRVFLPRDTIVAGDSAAVDVLFALVGGAKSTRVDYLPARFRVTLLGPDGKIAGTLGGSGPALGASGEMQMELPASSLLIQRQNLRCVTDFAYVPTPPARQAADCLGIYALTDPETYRVVVDYFGPEVWPTIDGPGARQKPKVPDRPLEPGLHLIDTVPLTVLRRGWL
jgi:hypothetical protein